MKREVIIILALFFISLYSAAAGEYTLEDGKEYCNIKVMAINPGIIILNIDGQVREFVEDEGKTIKDYDILVKNIFYSGKSSIVNWAVVSISPDLPSRCFREMTEEEKAVGFGENYTICNMTRKSEFDLQYSEIVENYYCPDTMIPESKRITIENLENSGLKYIKSNNEGFPDVNFIDCQGYQPEEKMLFEKITTNETEEYYRNVWICKNKVYYIFEYKNQQNKLYGAFGEAEEIEEQQEQEDNSDVGVDYQEEEKQGLIERFFSWIKGLFS